MNAIVENYLTYSLVPALVEKRFHIGDDTYRVNCTGVSQAGQFVEITRMGDGERRVIMATPGWEGATTTIPLAIEQEDESGSVDVIHSADVPVSWTGILDYDIEVYLHTVRNHIVTVGGNR